MDLNERVLDCVERGLATIGENTKYVVYRYMEEEKGLKPKDIPEKPDEFIDVLNEIFGIGAINLEKAIVREIAMEFEIALKSNGFVDAVRKVKELKP